MSYLPYELIPAWSIAHNEIKGRSKWGSYSASCVVKRKENSSVGYYLRAFRLRVDPRYGKDRTIPASLSSYSPIPWISSNIKTGGGELKSMRLPTSYRPSNLLSRQDKSKWTPLLLILSGKSTFRLESGSTKKVCCSSSFWKIAILRLSKEATYLLNNKRYAFSLGLWLLVYSSSSTRSFASSS